MAKLMHIAATASVLILMISGDALALDRLSLIAGIDFKPKEPVIPPGLADCAKEFAALAVPTKEEADNAKHLEQDERFLASSRADVEKMTAEYKGLGCDPDGGWSKECSKAASHLAAALQSVDEWQDIVNKARAVAKDMTSQRVKDLEKKLGTLNALCQKGNLHAIEPETSPPQDAASTATSVSPSPAKAKAEKKAKPSDTEQATDSDDQGDNDTIEDTGDDSEVTQGPTEEELEAAFPDPDKTATNNGGGTKPGDTGGDEDISKSCATNPNCELLTGGVSADTDDQATETTDDGNGVTAEPDGDNTGTTDDTAEDNSAASEPDNTQELTDDSSGASEANDGDDTAATESDNSDDSSAASEPDTTENNSGTDEPDEVHSDPTAGLLE
jgi:hypothetical protein